VKPRKVGKTDQQILNFKGFWIKGWTGLYEAKLPDPYFRLAYDAGLGSKNSQGFGMVGCWRRKGRKMLDAMSALALDYLREQIPDGLGDEPDPWKWYLRVREERPELLFAYLIEAPRDSMSPNYYVLKADPQDSDVAVLEQRERKPGDELRLPFVPSTGSQSGALGPVIKRTYTPAKGPGPSAKINDTSLKDFRGIANSDQPWSKYFEYVTAVVSRPKLRFRGELLEDGTAYACSRRSHNRRETDLLSECFGRRTGFPAR
jgi:hypothetical protein